MHPIVREGSAGALFGDKWFIFPGFDSDLFLPSRIEMYDIKTQEWTQLKDMPVPVSHTMALPIEDKIWFVGGYIGPDPGKASQFLQIYNPATNHWSIGPALPEAVGSAGSVVLNDKLHYFGGTLGDHQTNISNHFILDLAHKEQGWQHAAPMPEARTHFAVVVLNGKIYAIGGEYGHSVISVDTPLVHAYDPATDTWERKADLPYPLSHADLSTFVLNGKIIVMGGKSYRQFAIPTILSYDPEKNSWTKIGRLPEPLVLSTATMHGNDLYVAFGGAGSYAHPNGKVWVHRSFSGETHE